jgi:hypothetical protein
MGFPQMAPVNKAKKVTIAPIEAQARAIKAHNLIRKIRNKAELIAKTTYNPKE